MSDTQTISAPARALNIIYGAAGFLAAFFLVLIAVLTLAQIVGRLVGVLVPDAGDFAGFSMAASSFLGLAYTLRTGGHIRVNLVLSRLTGRVRTIVEIWCLLFATAIVTLFGWFSILLMWQSYDFGDVSTGLIGVPLWIPQIGMALGVSLLAVAFLEELVRVLRGGQATYEAVESDARTE